MPVMHLPLETSPPLPISRHEMHANPEPVRTMSEPRETPARAAADSAAPPQSCAKGAPAWHRTACGLYPSVTDALLIAIPIAVVATLVSVVFA